MADHASGPTTRPSLLLRLRDPHDGEAWSTFVKHYGPLIDRYCRRRLQKADVEDVSQEVLKAIFQSIRKFEYDRKLGQFRGWLFTVVHRKICRFIIKKTHQAHGLGGPASDHILEGVAAAEEQDWDAEFRRHVLQIALARCRSHFEERTLRAFELFAVEGRPADQVAQELEMGVSNVYVCKSRVQKCLREVIAELTGEDTL